MQPGEGVRSTDRAPLQGRERGGLRPSGPLVSLDHSDTWGHHLMKFCDKENEMFNRSILRRSRKRGGKDASIV